MARKNNFLARLEAKHEAELAVVRRFRDDKEIWYTKAKVDAALKDACGEYFEPWEMRYRKEGGNHGF